MIAVRCDHIERLTDPEFLSSILGPVRELGRESMGTPGFSGSTHERFHVTLDDGDRVSMVLKRSRLDRDWTAYRSDDVRGREALLLDSPETAAAWETFASPYIAFAAEEAEIGLLMHDLAPYLLPDLREPVSIGTEDAILGRLARLHALHWEQPLPEWLAQPSHHLSVVGPIVLGEDPHRPLPSPMGERVAEGWSEAFRLLPAGAAAILRVPLEEHERRLASLPRTLIHGDGKVANFAFLPGDRVAAFDWALAGQEPVATELGWYLAVNASRLARSKEGVIDRYRGLLEGELGRPLSGETWTELERATILSGALMLLWSKALAVRDERPGAKAEWEWWVDRLPA